MELPPSTAALSAPGAQLHRRPRRTRRAAADRPRAETAPAASPCNGVACPPMQKPHAPRARLPAALRLTARHRHRRYRRHRHRRRRRRRPEPHCVERHWSAAAAMRAAGRTRAAVRAKHGCCGASARRRFAGAQRHPSRCPEAASPLRPQGAGRGDGLQGRAKTPHHIKLGCSQILNCPFMKSRASATPPPVAARRAWRGVRNYTEASGLSSLPLDPPCTRAPRTARSLALRDGGGETSVAARGCHRLRR